MKIIIQKVKDKLNNIQNIIKINNKYKNKIIS